ncbi:MAG TPA: fatty acid desaturase, partial [Bacteroidia bacterium]|nr:fatty acid desaturase [Bacteroidia bacterium]
MASKKSFSYSEDPEPHKQRTKQILARHPEVRQLIGKNPFTIVAILFCVGSMILLSWLLKDAPWWAMLLVAYCVGAFFNHALFVLIHECSHN